MHNEAASHGSLKDGLAEISSLLNRINVANERYNAVMDRYLPAEKPMQSPWGRKRLRIGIFAAIGVIALNALSTNLFLYAAFALAAALVAGGVLLLVRGGGAKSYPFMLFGNAAVIVILIFSGGNLVGLRLTALLLAAAMVAGVILAVVSRDSYLSVVNQRIAEVNRSARADAFTAATAELETIDNEISDIQQAYQAGGYSSWFPQKYLEFDSVNALWHIINNGRADSLKEAINLHLQDLHHAYMRTAADHQAAMAQAQLAEQERTSRAVHAASVMNVGMQALQGSLTRSAIQAQGAATRAALNTPRTVRFK